MTHKQLIKELRTLRKHSGKILLVVAIFLLMLRLFLLRSGSVIRTADDMRPPLLWGYESNEGDCSDGMDNDSNGLTDCEDADACALATNCSENCTNGVDDDGDGAIDCDDTWCADDAACQ